MKSNSDERPLKFQNLGDGSWHYNHNIKEVEVSNDGITKTVFGYDTVQIWGEPNYEKCVKAVLRENYDESKEFSIINKYNAYVLNVLQEESCKTEYVAYLEFVKRVKEMVFSDFS